MKVEKLSKRKSKKIIIAITIIVLATGIIYITNSKAKYQITKSVQIVNGNVNYSLADFNLVAVKIQNKDSNGEGIIGNYTNGDVPINGYELQPLSTTSKETTHCEVNNNIQTDITITYENGKVNFNGISKRGTKCYLYFNVFNALTPEKRLDNLNLTVSPSGCPSYPNPTINNVYTGAGLLCKGQDDYGDTYYFRGNVTNNWVKMGDTYWRIIRINGDGTIRLIYNGKSVGATATSVNYGDNVNFNSLYDSAEYVGLKYTMGTKNGYEKASTILNALNTFYSSIMTYSNKLDNNAGFCGDRTSNTSSNAKSTNNTGGIGSTTTYYGGYLRLYNSKQPTFKCPEADTDLYTTNIAIKGNHNLTNPIGLITADEVMFAGGFGNENNSYWLHTGANYWTMTPSHFDGSYAYVYYILHNGSISYNPVHGLYGVRPVINLKADTKFIGQGTTGSPFVVQ